MNWKNEAVERLKRYESMKTAVRNMSDELQEASRVTPGFQTSQMDKVAVISSPSPDDSLMNNLVRKEELANALRQAKNWIRVTDRALGMLLPEEKLVLHRLYIFPERGAIDRLCEELNYEKSSVYRKRDQALLRFTRALYGFTET